MPRKQAAHKSKKVRMLSDAVAIVLLFLPFTAVIFRACTMHNAAKAAAQANNNIIYGI